MNDSGQVIGNYSPTATSSNTGYVFSGSTYTYFDPPGTNAAYGSAVNKINNAGVVAGGYTPTGSTKGIGYTLAGGVKTDYDIGAYATQILGLANNGSVSGFYADVASTGSANHGFAQFAGSSTRIDFGAGTFAWGVNSFGQAVYSTAGTAQRSFLYSGGTTSEIKVPGSAITAVTDINDSGQIVGAFRYTTGPSTLYGYVASGGSFGILSPHLGGSLIPYGINDLGQVVGYEQFSFAGGVLNAAPFIATPAVLPSSVGSSGYTFSISVIAGAPVFIDPEVAVGYDYAIGVGDPNFQTLRLPVGIGDGSYTVLLPNGTSFVVTGGELFDFTTHGFAGGVSSFSVRGIEIGAALNPADTQAFATGLTFVADGSFTGTMTPIVAAVDEPSVWMLGLAGLAMVGGARRSRTRRSACGTGFSFR